MAAPTIHAIIALNNNQPARRLTSSRAAPRTDLGTPICSAPGFFGILYPVYVRGLAYLAAHQGADAAAEFQKIIDRRSLIVSDPIGSLASLQLGRALAMTGDTVKAKVAYQTFLTLWKDADSDVAILSQAKAELAKPRRRVADPA